MSFSLLLMHLRSRALLANLAFLAACAQDGGAAPAPSSRVDAGAPPREVRTAIVQEQGWERTLGATGELAAWEEVVLAAKVPGRLSELPIDLGARVRRGELVAALETREYELRVAQAQAALDAARALLGLSAQGDGDGIATEETAVFRIASAQLDEARLARERAAALAREGVDSQAILDTAEARLREAESRLQEARELVENRRAVLAQRRSELEIARAQLSETRVEAPFDGVVVARLAARGSYLAPGAPIAELVRIDPLRLRLDVPEREASAVQAGQTVRVELEGASGARSGELVRLSPVLGERNRTLLVEAELANPDGILRPGAFARARIVLDPAASALTVPAEALVSFAGIDRVFVLPPAPASEQSVEDRRVEVGRREEGKVEILAGLAAGEEVVLAPGDLQGGASVRVAR